MRLTGISAVPVTPFAADGSVDEDGLVEVVARIVAAGIDVVVACGNTGEQASLTERESARIVEVTVAAAGDAAVIAGLGGELDGARRRGRAALDAGCAGLMVHFPTDPYRSAEGLVRYYERLAEALDAPLVPYLRAPGMPVEALERVVSIPSVVAVKYAVPDLPAFGRFVAEHGERVVPICGLAELWAPFFWLAGGRGFTSGLVNVAPRLSVAMLEALRAGDYDRAMELWRLVEPFERLRALHDNANNVPVVKEAMALAGLIRRADVRPPLSPLSEADRAALREIVAGWAELEAAVA